MVIRELVTGVCLHDCKTFGKDEPLVLVQRVAGQLITPESWPGCGSQPHPKEEPFELSISDPIYKACAMACLSRGGTAFEPLAGPPTRASLHGRTGTLQQLLPGAGCP